MKRVVGLALIWLCAAFYPFLAYAAAVEVNPVRIELTAADRMGTMQLKNIGDKPVTMHIYAVKWVQQQGQDIYQKTSELLLVPPIVTIAGGDTQLLRLGLRRPADPNVELAYRIFLQEVPPQVRKHNNAINTVFQIRVPVFVAPVAVRKQLSWSVTKSNNDLHLGLVNNGNTHIQITKLAIIPPNQQKPLVAKQVFNYLLPGQSAKWTLAIPKPLASNVINVYAATDQGDVFAAAQVIR